MSHAPRSHIPASARPDLPSLKAAVCQARQRSARRSQRRRLVAFQIRSTGVPGKTPDAAISHPSRAQRSKAATSPAQTAHLTGNSNRAKSHSRSSMSAGSRDRPHRDAAPSALVTGTACALRSMRAAGARAVVVVGQPVPYLAKKSTRIQAMSGGRARGARGSSRPCVPAFESAEQHADLLGHSIVGGPGTALSTLGVFEAFPGLGGGRGYRRCQRRVQRVLEVLGCLLDTLASCAPRLLGGAPPHDELVAALGLRNRRFRRKGGPRTAAP